MAAMKPTLNALMRPLLLATISLVGCGSEASAPTATPGAGAIGAATAKSSTAPEALPALPMDHHSYANPNAVRVSHVGLDLTLDFATRQVRGSARLQFHRLDPNAPLLLDSQLLTIGAVRGLDGKPRRHTLGDNDALLGQQLKIDLLDGDHTVLIDYTSDPAAPAMQWLAKEQTASGEMAYVYTQGQAILTRSWIPLQDTPGVRATFDARVRAPKGMRVVMSAAERGEEGEVFVFKMPHAIPSYLIALACGEIGFAEISERCGVYANPLLLNTAVAEFADTEAMLSKCEQQFGRYGWGRYDLLVLPPAFPFGGMENPTLTFVTPTILVGDKSLVALVAHELAHSWSGNLVTNATWRDFWLNEGFTVYLEQRIMELVYGTERAAMEIETSVRELRKEVAELPDKDQILHIDLTGRNPDDAMTAIAYDKGAAFLRRLEQVFGRATFDQFLQDYFKAHAFQSITTERFLKFLDSKLLARHADQASQVDVEEWVFGAGLPATLPSASSKGFAEVAPYRRQILQNSPRPSIDPSGWITHQWLEFLAVDPESVNLEQLNQWDQRFGFAAHGNPEIRTAFLILAIDKGSQEMMQMGCDFVREIGRRKFVLPIFRGLVKSEEGRRMAREVFDEIKPRLHHITRTSVAKLFQ